MMQAQESGWAYDLIDREGLKIQKQIESGERIIVGVNRAALDDTQEREILVHEVHQDLVREHVTRLTAFKRAREEETLRAALLKLRKEAKEKMMNKTKEMDTLMKARLSDFKKKEKEQQKKVQQKNSFEPTGNVMMENQDVIQVALDVATSELNPAGEGSFAKIQFSDGSQQNLDNFSAKRIAACYAQLDDTHKQQFQYMLNKDAASYQSALDFAVRNV